MMRGGAAPLMLLGGMLMLGIASCGSDHAGMPVPTAAPAKTPAPPTATPMETPLPPTATPTETPALPTTTPTGTPVPAKTPTNPPTETPTEMPVPTETPEPPGTPKTAYERGEHMTEEEFKNAVMGKDEREVIAAVGEPDEIKPSGPYTYWEYVRLTKDEFTGDVDAAAEAEFRDGRVIGVYFRFK